MYKQYHYKLLSPYCEKAAMQFRQKGRDDQERRELGAVSYMSDDSFLWPLICLLRVMQILLR